MGRKKTRQKEKESGVPPPPFVFSSPPLVFFFSLSLFLVPSSKAVDGQVGVLRGTRRAVPRVRRVAHPDVADDDARRRDGRSDLL